MKGPKKTGFRNYLKKGDLIRYGDKHVSIVHSDRWGESVYDGDYDVIHAFSYECSNNCGDYPWLRKVGITADNHPGLPASSGFGRIKLWE